MGTNKTIPIWAFRCLAFRSEGQLYDPLTLTDVWLPAHDFYSILQHWHSAFLAEWEVLPKESEVGD